VLDFYVTRDITPQKWYPRLTDGTVNKFDDVPQPCSKNTNTELPFKPLPGNKLRLNVSEIQDIIAFLKTLTDAPALRGVEGPPRRERLRLYQPPTSSILAVFTTSTKTFMELIRGIHNLRPSHRHCALTIGNFDGMHLGHRTILQQLRERADALGVPATVMLFEPQPREFFEPDTAPPRLMTLREKLEILQQLAVDRVLCVRFSEDFRQLTADLFVEKILVEGLAAQHLVVGDDFRFGSDRCGDFAFLERAGQQYGFAVERRRTFAVNGARVSSTRLREVLEAGDFASVEQLTGEPYSISGRVSQGEKLGRRIGVPTANILLKRIHPVLRGVYAVRVQGADTGKGILPGVANIGTRPTVGGTGNRLEVHLLNFTGDLYAQRIHVTFLKKLRAEVKFDSLDALKTQIQNDINQATQFLNA
jgi:riboflavin kinase / FMN adenylyltransferase